MARSCQSLPFHPSDGPTVGVEIELQLLDGSSLDLIDAVMPLLAHFGDYPHVSSELTQPTIEVTSPPCRNTKEVRAHLAPLLVEVRAAAAQRGVMLAGAGCHPFCTRWAQITPLPRYFEIERSHGSLVHTHVTYALQVHVGMSSPDEMMRVMHRLRASLPIFMALSASSPVWGGFDTGFASYRHRMLAATRTYGIPPHVPSWRDFEHLFCGALRAGMFASYKDIHWDIRPRPDYGTVELRGMDAQPTLARSLALTALAHSFMVYLQRTRSAHVDERLPRALPWWLEKENHYRASRDGLGAALICDEGGATRPLSQVAEDVFDVVAPVADELGEGEEIEEARALLDEGPSYRVLRDIHRREGSAKKVAAAIAAALEEELAREEKGPKAAPSTLSP